MTTNHREKQAVRARMALTGENYTTALRYHRAEQAERQAACPCGCAALRGGRRDECTCTEPCACSPNCGYCDADVVEASNQEPS
jgi:hypothetical protein